MISPWRLGIISRSLLIISSTSMQKSSAASESRESFWVNCYRSCGAKALLSDGQEVQCLNMNFTRSYNLSRRAVERFNGKIALMAKYLSFRTRKTLNNWKFVIYLKSTNSPLSHSGEKLIAQSFLSTDAAMGRDWMTKSSLRWLQSSGGSKSLVINFKQQCRWLGPNKTAFIDVKDR